MPIYKYTIIKYLKSYSTWIITLFSILLIFILVGVVAFGSLIAGAKYVTSYASLSIILIGLTTSFMALFASIFAGFKAASMYKDEVEDGTFLIMLSKPVRRSKIIFFKWLALLTILIIYTFIMALTFLFTVLIFDKGHKFESLEINGITFNTLRSQIIEISALMWAIWMVAALIFSSFALLISTKLSVGTTIGIVVGLGVVTPMTGMIGMFTQKPAFAPLNVADVTLLENYDNKFGGDIEIDFKGTPDAPTLYNVGIGTNDIDSFQNAWIADINFQVSTLSLIPSSAAIPKEINDFLGVIGSSGNTAISKNTYIENKEAINKELFPDNRLLLDHMIDNSWNALEPLRTPAIELLKIQAAILEDFSATITPDLKSTLSNLGIEVTNNTFTKADLMTLLNYNYQEKSTLEQSYFFIAIDQFKTLYSIQTNVFNDAAQNVDIYPTLSALDRLVSPLFWFDDYKIKRFAIERDIIIDKSLSPNMTAIPNSVALNIIGNKIENNVYSTIASAINAGYQITSIKAQEYVNRYSILYVYITIAIALVPIAYFVVRRQDYR